MSSRKYYPIIGLGVVVRSPSAGSAPVFIEKWFSFPKSWLSPLKYADPEHLFIIIQHFFKKVYIQIVNKYFFNRGVLFNNKYDIMV